MTALCHLFVLVCLLISCTTARLYDNDTESSSSSTTRSPPRRTTLFLRELQSKSGTGNANVPSTLPHINVKTKFIIAPSMQNRGYSYEDMISVVDEVNVVLESSHMSGDAGRLHYVYHSHVFDEHEHGNDVVAHHQRIYSEEEVQNDYQAVLYLFYNETTTSNGYWGLANQELCRWTGKASIAVANAYLRDLPVHETLHTAGAVHSCGDGWIWQYNNAAHGMSECNIEQVETKMATYDCLAK